MMKYLLTALMLSLAAPAAALTSFEPDPAGVCEFAGFGSLKGLEVCLGAKEGVIKAPDLSGVLGVAEWQETSLVEFDEGYKLGAFSFDDDKPVIVSIKAGPLAAAGPLLDGLLVYDLVHAVSHYRTFSPVAAVPLPAPLLMFGSLLLATGLWYRFAIK